MTAIKFEITDASEKRTYTIKPNLNLVKIGTDSKSHIQTTGGSRMHAIIEVGSDSVTIIDLGNPDGTIVNSARINKCQLKVGDVIEVGCTKIEILSILSKEKKPKTKVELAEELLEKALNSSNNSSHVLHEFKRIFTNDGIADFKYTGIELIKRVKGWAKQYDEAHILTCNDCAAMGSIILLIEDRSEETWYGLTGFVIPQQLGEKPVEFDLNYYQLLAFNSKLNEIALLAAARGVFALD